MIKCLLINVIAVSVLTALGVKAQAQPIIVKLSTSIGDYDLGMDLDDIYISQTDIFTNISFVYNTGRTLFPSPDGEKVTFESFAVLFATTQTVSDVVHMSVAGDGIVRGLQESTLFLSGIDTEFPFSDYNGNVDFNVLSMSVSAVPLPSSAPLFGAAFLGLAGLGYGMKRKKPAAAV